MGLLNVEGIWLERLRATNVESIVHKYCFALANPPHSECHLRVGEFPDPERAFQLAQLIALELGIEADGQWSGWTVEVRSLQGQRLFAAPVAGALCSLPDAAA